MLDLANSKGSLSEFLAVYQNTDDALTMINPDHVYPVRAATRFPIEENARAVIEAVSKARPNSIKGTYINSCTLSATMSPPVRVDVKEFQQAA